MTDNDNNSNNNNNNNVVHFAVSHADLLSNGRKSLTYCSDPSDPTCSGGVAMVEYLMRQQHEQGQDQGQEQPSLVLYSIDKTTPFVQMHPAGWAVNRYILHDLLGAAVFVSPPSLLVQNSVDYSVSTQDLTALQSPNDHFKYLLTNAAVPVSNSWHYFHTTIHFDTSTGLAILDIDDPGAPLAIPQIEATKGALQYIQRLNQRRDGCTVRRPDGGVVVDDDDQSTTTTTMSTAEAIYDNLFASSNQTTATPVNDDIPTTSFACWVPVVCYTNVQHNYIPFINAMSELEHPPALVVETRGHDVRATEQPIQLPSGMWISSYNGDRNTHVQHKLVRNSNPNTPYFSSVERNETSIKTIPPEAMTDSTFQTRIAQLKVLSDQAVENDPAVTSYPLATPMPLQRGNSTYYRCQGGECEMGNLFSDAVQWYSGADIAFFHSGGLRGGDWEVGNVVHMSDIWNALPFPNGICTGVMSGLSLYELVSFSVNSATFQTHGTDSGGNLIQVAKTMKIVYNTQMAGDNKLVSVHVWNTATASFEPIDRMRLYTFATDSYLCGSQLDFTELTGPNFRLQGEVPGMIDDTVLQQDIVGQFLGHLTEPYMPMIEGRLVNDTNVFDPLSLTEDEDSCVPGKSYWVPDLVSCQPCPYVTNLRFSDKIMYFETRAGEIDSSFPHHRIILVNRETYKVQVMPKSVPSWIDVAVEETSAATSSGQAVADPNNGALTLDSGESAAFRVTVLNGPDSLFANRTTVFETSATVSFGILGLDHPGCLSQDAVFDVSLRVTPNDLNHYLGSIRIVGFVFMVVILATSLFFAGWVKKNRNAPAVVTMQPNFLVALCSGIFIIGLAIVPMSLDDEVMRTENGCNFACMLSPWLLCSGLTISFSALISKLWRVNKIFGARALRRMVVRERDVLAPFAILSTVNTCLLLVWTVIDPLRWERRALGDDTWNTYGACVTGHVGKIVFHMIAGVNVSALIYLCFHAYQARNLSESLSESKYIGFAIFSWLEVVLVGLPVMLLIRGGSPKVTYFLDVALMFVLSMSMLLLIFCPLVLEHQAQLEAAHNGVRRSSAYLVTPARGRGPSLMGSSYNMSSNMKNASSLDEMGVAMEANTSSNQENVDENEDDNKA